MLQAFPTKNGTGISIYGDYADLSTLYDTIHHFSNTLDESKKPQKAQFQLLMNFAYEVRKALSGQRLVDKLTFDDDTIEPTYYGFQLVWTDVLIFVNVLRHNAGYSQSDKMHQANLYLFEFVVEKALDAYDAMGAIQIKDLIDQRINVSNEYAFIIYQAVHITFVSEKPGKQRFRKIPQLIKSHFNEFGQDYKSLIASFEKSAKQQNCAVADLEFSDFPEIVW